MDPGEELEQRGLSGSILADNTDDFPLKHVEVDILESPDIVRTTLGGTVVGLAYLEIGILMMQHLGLPPAVQVVGQGTSPNETEPV